MNDGWGRSTVIEPLTVASEYAIQWLRPEIDLAELARLRFVEGWTLHRLMRHFGCRQGALYRSLKGHKLPKNTELRSLSKVQ